MKKKNKQVIVISRDGKDTGVMTGGTRQCQMEGCNCERYGVRWKSDNKLTWLCGKSLNWKSEYRCKLI